MRLDLAEGVLEQPRELPRAFLESPQPSQRAAVERPAALPAQGELKRAEVRLVQPSRCRLVEPAEIHLRVFVGPLPWKLNINRRIVIKGIWADAVLGKVAQIFLVHRFFVLLLLQVVITIDWV